MNSDAVLDAADAETNNSSREMDSEQSGSTDSAASSTSDSALTGGDTADVDVAGSDAKSQGSKEDSQQQDASLDAAVGTEDTSSVDASETGDGLDDDASVTDAIALDTWTVDAVATDSLSDASPSSEDSYVDAAEDSFGANGSDGGGNSDATQGDALDGGIDTDNDGLPDSVELWLGTDPLKSDTDGDGLLDGEEANPKSGTKTDPTKADTDGDGLSDGVEIKISKTDATMADSDGDGLTDGEEVQTHGTDPNKADTDGDGLSDGLELGKAGDSDPSSKTDPKSADTDGDGQPDGVEDANKNGKVDAGETDPNDPKSVAPLPGGAGSCKSVADCDDGNACTTENCEKGTCNFVSATEGTKCSTGNAWTLGSCTQGSCKVTTKAYCPTFTQVPPGTQPPVPYFNVAGSTVPGLWLPDRPATAAEVLACVAAGACPSNAVPSPWMENVPTSGIYCAAGACTMTSAQQLAGNQCPMTYSPPICQQSGVSCANPKDEPMPANTPILGASYCNWLGGRLMTKTELYYATNGGCAPVDVPAGWKATYYSHRRFCGLVPLMVRSNTTGGDLSPSTKCSGTDCTSTFCRTAQKCDYAVQNGWLTCTDAHADLGQGKGNKNEGEQASAYSFYGLGVVATNTSQGKIVCAFETKPVCN